MHPDLDRDELLTDSEVQELLGVSRTTLWRMRQNTGLPFGKVGHEYRYRKSEILDWVRINGRGFAGTPAVPTLESDREKQIAPRTDIYSEARRSEIMSRIGGRDTRPELAVRRMLREMGVGYRLHMKGLPGRPDIVFPRRRKVIFVHGCFWHQHPGCSRSKIPSTRSEWWAEKLHRNTERDAAAVKGLDGMGWSVLVLWQCQLRDPELCRRLLSDFLGANARSASDAEQ